MKGNRAKAIRGSRARLTGLASVLPLPPVVIIALLTKPDQESLFSYSISLLAGPVGMLVGFVISMVMTYGLPNTD